MVAGKFFATLRGDLVVSFSLRQVTNLVDQSGAAPLYRVINQVEAAVGASPAVFVYRTSTRSFEHYASAADMERWPDSPEEATVNGLAYYRLSSVSRTWATVAEMNADVDGTLARVRSLANEISRVRSSVLTDRTTLVEAP